MHEPEGAGMESLARTHLETIAHELAVLRRSGAAVSGSITE